MRSSPVVVESDAAIARDASESRAALSPRVWDNDKTDQFVLEDQDSIGPNGQLILPKLFRRSTDYLKDVAKGAFDGNLDEWLVWKSGGAAARTTRSCSRTAPRFR